MNQTLPTRRNKFKLEIGLIVKNMFCSTRKESRREKELLAESYLKHYKMIFQKFIEREESTLHSFIASQPSTPQSQLYLLKHMDSPSMEQHCLSRLKAHRQSLQQLTETNLSLQNELEKVKKERTALHERIEEIEEISKFKDLYSQLKEQFENLLASHQLAEFEIQELKTELEQVVTSSMEEAEQMRTLLRRQKENEALTVAHLNALLADKEEEIRRVIKEGKSSQERLTEQLEQINQEKQRLKELLKEQGSELEENESQLKKELRTKQTDLVGCGKTIEQLKKQVNTLKLNISTIQFEHDKDREDYLQAIQQSRTALRLLTKERQELQIQNADLKETVKNYQHKNNSLKESVQGLKRNLATLKQQSQSNLAKQAHRSQQENQQLQLTVTRLKKEIEKHVEDYNLLSIEYKRSKALLEQTHLHDKQRRARAVTQLHQISKIQKETIRIK